MRLPDPKPSGAADGMVLSWIAQPPAQVELGPTPPLPSGPATDRRDKSEREQFVTSTGTANDPVPAHAGPAAGQRWTARAAFAAMIAAVVVLVASEGPIGLTLLGVGLLGTVTVLVGGFWFIAKRGVLRWVGLTVVVVAVVAVVVVFFRAGVVAVAVVALLLLLVGGAAARHALQHAPEPWMPTAAPSPVTRPFIVMNPRSGGGKVVRFDLAQPRPGRWAPKSLSSRARGMSM